VAGGQDAAGGAAASPGPVGGPPERRTALPLSSRFSEGKRRRKAAGPVSHSALPGVVFRNLRSELQTAREGIRDSFHAVLKFPAQPWRGTWEQYDEALQALAIGLLTPNTWGTFQAPSERLVVANATNGEEELACTRTSGMRPDMFMEFQRIATKAFSCLSPDSTRQEPLNSFSSPPRFLANYHAQWMLFVYRRLAGSPLVVTRRATELRFNRVATSFRLAELDERVLVTYLSVAAILVPLYAIDLEFNIGDDKSPALPVTQQPPATPAPLIPPTEPAGARSCDQTRRVRDLDPRECSHAPDYTSVIWFGVRYEFAKGLQAESVRALWEAWEIGGHGLSEGTIREVTRSGNNRFRLWHVFAPKDKETGKRKPHKAWGTMIRPTGKGIYRLTPPDGHGITT
jgi:hypothetical protein